MFATPTRGTPRGRLQQIPEGPISEFCAVIESTPAEEWQKRTAALQKLVSRIPGGPEFDHGVTWYNTPTTLRHLALPLSELLKDARSTVVKRTCESLASLFNKCQAESRYLFKDIMPAILAVHAQTVLIIRQAVQDLVVQIIPEIPCKMVMPLWMDRLKVEKSRTVREACALYLGLALQSWTEEGYLTDEIWLLVGSTLLRTIRDPSPVVRVHTKQALEIIKSSQPAVWETMLNGPDSIVTRDLKLRRWLDDLGSNTVDVEELSVASRISHSSDARFSIKSSGLRQPSPRPCLDAIPSQSEADDDAVPMSIQVQVRSTAPKEESNGANAKTGVEVHSTRLQYKGLGPPLRRATPPFPQAAQSPAKIDTGTPPRPPPPPPPNPPAARRLSVDTKLESIEDVSDSQNSEPDHSPRFPPDLNGVLFRLPPKEELEKLSPKLINKPQQQIEKPNVVPTRLAEEPVKSAEISDHSEDITAKSTDVSESAGETVENVVDATPQQEETADLPHDEAEERDLPTDEFQTPPETEAVDNIESGDIIGSSTEVSQESTQTSDKDSDASRSDPVYFSTVHDLKQYASRRRSRYSLLMKQRFRNSGSLVGQDEKELKETDPVIGRRSEEENEAPNSEAVVSVPTIESSPSMPTSPQAPEHIAIAIRLLRSHKYHVDQIMETLRIEMDSLRDFDRLLEIPGRPTEEEVLDYFESVGLCLEQRTLAGTQLQREMDRISEGEPPEDSS